jgi:hypothetical protein
MLDKMSSSVSALAGTFSQILDMLGTNPAVQTGPPTD